MRRFLSLVLWAAALGEIQAGATTFTVTTILDTGAGSLRQAITDANANPGLDRIEFNIPGTGLQTITLHNLLPEVTDPVEIDASTQPGYAGSPLVVLSSDSSRVTSLLKLSAPGNTVRALNISRSGTSSVAEGLVLTGPGGNRVVACWIGLDGTGLKKGSIRPAGLHIIDSANNVIGGTAAPDQNTISGCTYGVLIEGTASTGTVIQGNYIGTDPAGSIAIGNFFSGIVVSNASNTTIGGTLSGARNIISANFPQITIVGSSSSGNVVAGNWIGLKADGTPLFATGSGHGIVIDNAPGNTVGGLIEAARNVIGNNDQGVMISGTNATANLVQGNFIGTDPTGKIREGNAFGVRIAAGAHHNLIGGTAAGAGNLISGNYTTGLSISEASSNTVQGNLIGTDISGTVALGTGTPGKSSSALTIAGNAAAAEGNLVGGTTAAARNVISGNNDDGVVLLGALAQHNLIQGNYIGLAADGQTVLGNTSQGVAVLAANENLIGGETRDAANYIAGNGLVNKRPGVWLARLFGDFGDAPATGNQVLRNTIAQNGGPGVILLGPNKISLNEFIANGGIPIDRGGDGPTANSPDSASNFPELTSAVFGSIKVRGHLKGTPNCVYAVEIYYEVASLDLPFVGVQTIPLGRFPVTTDSSGNASFDEELPYTGPGGVPVSVRASSFSDGCGSESSELSSAIAVAEERANVPVNLNFEVAPSREFRVFPAPPLSSTPQEVVFQSVSDIAPTNWINIEFGTNLILSPEEYLKQFVRAVALSNAFRLAGTLTDGSGNPLPGIRVGLGTGPRSTLSDIEGKFALGKFANGRSRLAIQHSVEKTDTRTGTKTLYERLLEADIDVQSDILDAKIKAELDKDEVIATQLGCECTPWCAIMGGTVNGVQMVVASGGKDGFCLDDPEVTITGPNGTQVHFPAAPFPKRKRETFSPAANGVWTVTSTVCGKTKTCTITLP